MTKFSKQEVNWEDVSSLASDQLCKMLNDAGVLIINNVDFKDKKDMLKFILKLGTLMPYSLTMKNNNSSNIVDTMVREVEYFKSKSIDNNNYTNNGDGWHIDIKWDSPDYKVFYNSLYSWKIPSNSNLGKTTLSYTPAILKTISSDELAYWRTLKVRHARSKSSLIYNQDFLNSNRSIDIDDAYVLVEDLIQTTDSGKEYLFLSPLDVIDIVGLSKKDSNDLIDRLINLIVNNPCSYSHQWMPNQLLLTINRLYPHKVTVDFDPLSRILWRVWAGLKLTK